MSFHDFSIFGLPIVMSFHDFGFDLPIVMSLHDFRLLDYFSAADQKWVPFSLIITRGDLFFVASAALIQFSSVTDRSTIFGFADRDEVPRFSTVEVPSRS